MEEKKNLASLSKGTKTTKITTKTSTGTRGGGVKTTTNKSTVKTNADVISERDLKAKETVSKLLNDVPLMNKKEEIKMETTEIKKGTEWLEEQLQTLTEKNEALENEAAIARENYSTILSDYQKLKEGGASPEKVKVIELFNELQDNYGNLGQNFKVYFPAFLNRMVMFFPFLSNHKRF